MTAPSARDVLSEVYDYAAASSRYPGEWPRLMALAGIGLAILELKDALSDDAPPAGPWVQAMLPGLGGPA
jgi:hypothetical protein